MGKYVFYIVSVFFVMGCGPAKRLKPASKANAIFDSYQNQNHFTGFLLVDPILKDTLHSLNACKYFTPASTTKIFTLYTALQLLPERIPTLKYIAKNDTLFFEGTGDPTLLHSYFKDSTAIDFLKEYEHIAWHPNNFRGDLLGPGWAVEDYQYYFQVERGALPMYGNVITIHQTDTLQVAPTLFGKNVVDLDYHLNREELSNTFYYSSSRSDTITIPYRTDSVLTATLLETVLQKKIHHAKTLPEGTKSVLYGIHADSVYKRMMHESDNFLADQLLILSSSMLSDTLDGKKAREYILENKLANLRQPPRWVDGSGLSRYNLFTPESMLGVLSRLQQEMTQERLFKLFPSWEALGTSSNMNTGNGKPYIYAKSGSVGNNYSLNGYVLTKSGKVLIFSFMNNHFTIPSKQIRIQIQQLLQQIHRSY